MKLTYSERETEETERGMKRQKGVKQERSTKEHREEEKRIKKAGNRKKIHVQGGSTLCNFNALWVRGWVFEVRKLNMIYVLYSVPDFKCPHLFSCLLLLEISSVRFMENKELLLMLLKNNKFIVEEK